MAGKFTAAGTLQDWKPAEGSVPGRGMIGGIRITVWASEWVNGEKVGSFIYADIKKRAESGNPKMKVSGEVQDPKEGQERWGPNYIVSNVGDATDEEVAAGDAKTAEKAQRRGGPGRPQAPRDETWQAARWAISTSIDAIGEGLDLTDKKGRDRLEEVSIWVLGFSQELRDRAKKTDAPAKADSEAGTVTPTQARDW